MGNKQWGFTIAAVALALVFGQFGRWQYRKAVKFEADAKLALMHEHTAQVEKDLLADENKRLVAEAAKKHARTDTLTRVVVVVDSIHPPDTSCAPNLAARDAVIASKTGEISDLQAASAVQARSINLLQASKDELAKVLASRPSYYPRFVGPNIGIGVFAGACGVSASGKLTPCVGVGVTVNLFSLRL